MTIAATQQQILAQAKLKTKQDLNHQACTMIDNNLSTIISDEMCSAEYKEKDKTTYLNFEIIGTYLVVMKHSISGKYKSAIRYFKIALSEFEPVVAP